MKKTHNIDLLDKYICKLNAFEFFNSLKISKVKNRKVK